MYGKWFRVNVIHDVGEGKVTFFIDGVQKLQEKDHGPGDLYFKCGVYAQKNDSHYMESSDGKFQLLAVAISLPTMAVEVTAMYRPSVPKMSKGCYYGLLLLILSSVSYDVVADPTDGFTLVPLTDANFDLQKPYDKPLNERYSYRDGIRSLWVYTNDKPFKPDSGTRPRTEIRIRGLDYSSGVWQFEGSGFVPNGTSGVTIVQIHGAAKGATTLQLRIYDGDMRYYRYDLIDTNLYNRWFRVNVIHDVGAGKLTVFINGIQKFVVKDQGPGDLYFKCGVYAAPANSSYYMESRWRDIKIYKK
ncbi:Alginate lyase 2 [Dillenia turbinata]|uniref:Alginate lyase 2 n=1 Tax=Dillenia turbinata TaxID=194707 RepID=A0AAN8VYQ9_9MAGN